MRPLTIILIILGFNISNTYASGAFSFDNPSKFIIGKNQTYIIKAKETLIKLAREYDIGYNEIIAANSTIDPWVPEKGTRILIPTSWLIPEILDDGILINLSEMRLYYFFTINRKRYIRTFPIGIGRQGLSTPTGTFEITLKLKDPTWHVPDNIRKEQPELPSFIPPGPDNPLGRYWLQLSINGYGLHGTNRPFGIGRSVSHGCIRLYPEDIEVLFRYVKPGTKVKIIDEPVKVGMFDNKVYIEVHRSDRTDSELTIRAAKKLSGKSLLHIADPYALIKTIKRATGLPTVISR